MSDTDSFIREVTEEVRQDRMLRYWKRYGPWVIGAIVLVVAAAALWSWQQERRAAEARERGAAFLAAPPADVEAAARLVETAEGPSGRVAALRHAGALAASGETEAAITAYGRVAGDPAAGALLRDLAGLAAIRLEARRDPAAAIDRLAPLAAEGAPFRLLALELRAVLQLTIGDTDAAHADLSAILADPARTGGLDARARALLEASGGAAGTVTN